MHRFTRFFLILIVISGTMVCAQNRVVGYYPNWVSDSMPVDELDFSILSHVNHAFAWPTAVGVVQSYLGMFDVDLNVTIHENGGYILLSFGGWGNSDGFGPMTSDADTRQTFIDNVIQTCQYYEYDGVDFDWEHPQNSVETDNYTLLIQELRAAVDTTFDNFLITMAIPATHWSAQHYDLTALQASIDWFNAMTYDYHGTWSTHAGHNAPLYQSPVNDPDGSCHFSMNYLLNNRDVNPTKLNLGLSFYGKEFGASVINGNSTGGNITYQYNEIVGLLDQGWTYQWDEVASAAYLQNPEMTRLITYDDPQSIEEKSEYAASRGLGGVMIWALGQDYISGQAELLEVLRPYALSTDEDNESLISDSYQVISNYPNPFNPGTTIKYTLSEQSDVTLIIYDVIGKEIQNLVSRSQSQGNYQVSWNGTNYAGQTVEAGMYFAMLQGGEHLSVLKMVYLR